MSYKRTPERETPLTGGNMTPVMRVGNTVRRQAGPWTPVIHKLLEHIRARGFGQAPEPFGLDGKGREIVSFIPGQTGSYPLPEFMWSDKMLVNVAEMLRSYHDATVGFDAPPDTPWQWRTHEPSEVICHNDFAPYNLVFKNNKLVGVIDFDTASPGPRVWDVAYTVYRFAPLTDPNNPDVPDVGREEKARRLALFCKAYGLDMTPAQVLDTALERLRELISFIEDSAAKGDEAQKAVLERGDTEIYKRDAAYIRNYRQQLSK